LFDAKENILTSVPTRINPPNIPLEFWSDASLESIGEVLGKLIVSNDSYKTKQYALGGSNFGGSRYTSMII
jgi:hypothetical protein